MPQMNSKSNSHNSLKIKTIEWKATFSKEMKVTILLNQLCRLNTHKISNNGSSIPKMLSNLFLKLALPIIIGSSTADMKTEITEASMSEEAETEEVGATITTEVADMQIQKGPVTIIKKETVEAATNHVVATTIEVIEEIAEIVEVVIKIIAISTIKIKIIKMTIITISN